MGERVGLCNLGNTCYLNSCVQILRKIGEFRDIVTKYSNSIVVGSTTPKNEIERSNIALLHAWTQLHNGIHSISNTTPNTIIANPATFVKTVYESAAKQHREIFTGYAQNDVSEFLLFLVNGIHDAIKRPVQMKINGKPSNEIDTLAVQCYKYIQQIYSKEYSEIMELFYGISVTQICSPGATTTPSTVLSTCPEHFFVLDLPVANHSTIYESFDAFCAKEILDGENAWFNELTNTKEPSVTKNTVFWNFPKILIITLNRSSHRNRKNSHPIKFPIENLDLMKYVIGYRSESYMYDLFGVCNHYGGTYAGGHYTAFSRTIDPIHGTKSRWMEYNDTHVTEIDNPVSSDAYCLFYRKK